MFRNNKGIGINTRARKGASSISAEKTKQINTENRGTSPIANNSTSMQEQATTSLITSEKARCRLI
ncbi:7341_t:CDS:2 [Diversispora eburnea]|uniref:7341_t:CDS:1 n=1 Tax=Diversispora eburnea TaxID=1213867 RepID=A0A9N8YHV9_9GLOM|nr:7341_t:CDS:2 [Diversispora eburnea]